MTPLTGIAFADRTTLTSEEVAEITFAFNVVRYMRHAGFESGILTPSQIRVWGHCLLGSTALNDVLHKLGRTDATFFRVGCANSIVVNGERANVGAVGHPGAPRGPLWNAHMTNLLGNIILDSTFGQLNKLNFSAPDFAVVKRHEGRARSFDLFSYGAVEEIAIAVREIANVTYEARYFRLPRKQDLASRKWRSLRDALPERRTALVAKTLKLIELDCAAGTFNVPERAAA